MKTPWREIVTRASSCTAGCLEGAVTQRFATAGGCSAGSCVEVGFLKASQCSTGTCVEVGFKTAECNGGACVEVGFRKAGGCTSGNCVEVGMGYQKASDCGTSTCVEVDLEPAEVSEVHVRDSKQEGIDPRPVLRFTPDEWRAFVAGVKRGEFDLPEPAPAKERESVG